MLPNDWFRDKGGFLFSTYHASYSVTGITDERCFSNEAPRETNELCRVIQSGCRLLLCSRVLIIYVRIGVRKIVYSKVS